MFTVQQLSLNALSVFNLQLQGYSSAKFYSNRFRIVWDVLRNKRGRFFSERSV